MKKICFLIFVSLALFSGCSDKAINSESSTIEIAKNYLKENFNGKVKLKLKDKIPGVISPEGFRIKDEGKKVIISSPTPEGLLYGAFALTRIKDNGQFHAELDTVDNPFYEFRIFDHWDNLDGTVERGYAGRSLWKWDQLPDSLSEKYEEYALMCAEIGINGIVINNVNANPEILSQKYLDKVKALADFFRNYGIKVYLSVNFASPMVLDNLPTADPLDSNVSEWWKNKADEIYSLIPDFGGFLVKANSEGQPGPCDFGRTHADGANMLAEALKPHGGIVMWRAFVYSPSDADRAKQAYQEFQPLDGKFNDNVIIQIKNGPIDFQPREPYSPLFIAMPNTPLMAEFQVTQEYLGQANHLAFLAPMWKEFFGYVSPRTLKGVAGVANIGDNDYMTGHPLADANRYAFGRLAWNPELGSDKIIEEWTAGHLFDDITDIPDSTRNKVNRMFLNSREAVVNYMMPLGLHHIFAFGHHYGPQPWCDIDGARADWMPKYYHKADKEGLGFDRSSTGSNATAQYPDSLRQIWDDINSCPEEFLLWFHHVPWNHRMKSGNTLWEELCYKYQAGVDTVNTWSEIWEEAGPYLEIDIYDDVKKRLNIQEKDAIWWRDACLLYFKQFSRQPLPEKVGKPHKNLEDYMKIQLPISNFENPSYSLLDQYR